MWFLWMPIGRESAWHHQKKTGLSQAFQTTSDSGCTSGHIRSPRLDDSISVHREKCSHLLAVSDGLRWVTERGGGQGCSLRVLGFVEGSEPSSDHRESLAQPVRLLEKSGSTPSRCLLRTSCAVFYVCSASLQPFIGGFIKISTPQQLAGNTHLLRLITCNAHLLSADRTAPHRAAPKPSFFFAFYLLSALCSCEHLPAPQIGRPLCQVCAQMAPWRSHRELHALLVWRLRWKRQPLWDARAVSEGVWETR